MQGFNGYPSGPCSNLVGYTIAGVKPSVTSLSPPSAAAGSPGFALTINGAGFLSCDCAGGPLTVKWNGQPLTVTSASSTQLIATVPATLLGSAGTASVTVANPGSTLLSDPVIVQIVGQFTMSCIPAAGPTQTGIAYTSTCAASGGSS